MNTFKLTYFNLVFLFVLSFTSCKTQAQTKSSDIKTINGKKYYIHKVEKGQSLYAIARVYNMDVNSILAENDEAIDGLKPGQELKIPVESLLTKNTTTPIDTNKYVYHKVAKGETVYAITKKYAIDEKHLFGLNPNLSQGLKDGDFIIVGEKKKTTVSKPTAIIDANLYDSYAIQQGETMYGLSKKFNLSQDELLKLNPELKDGIKSGQIIKLPKTKQNSGAITSNTVSTPPTVAVSNSVTPSNHVSDTLKYNKPKKSSYEIGLLLPFKLNEAEQINVDELAKAKLNFPSSQSLALDFYAGFKRAIDSIAAKDFEVNLNLFDVQDKDSLNIENICKSSDFKKLDAAFGPLYLNEFKIAANRAKALNIPCVSPVIQQNKILFKNSLCSKVTPSVYTLIEGLADYCADSLMHNTNIIIVNTTPKDIQYLKTFKKRFNDNLIAKGKSLKDSVIEVKGIAGIKNAYKDGKKNVILMFTYNQVYLQDIITQLYMFADKKDLMLMGFESVGNIDNLDQEYLNKLQFHFATSNHVNYKDSLTLGLIKQYQEINSTDPSEYYFEGFDVGMYYLGMLKQHGPDVFLNLDKYNYNGVSTGFKYFRPDTETGFENRAMSIYRYSNYTLQKIGWK